MSKFTPYQSGDPELNLLQSRIDRALKDISTLLDQMGSTRGSILFRGANGWAILPPGLAGQLLTTNGPGADPSWT